jgi:hypothetical protein
MHAVRCIVIGLFSPQSGALVLAERIRSVAACRSHASVLMLIGRSVVLDAESSDIDHARKVIVDLEEEYMHPNAYAALSAVLTHLTFDEPTAAATASIDTFGAISHHHRRPRMATFHTPAQFDPARTSARMVLSNDRRTVTKAGTGHAYAMGSPVRGVGGIGLHRWRLRIDRLSQYVMIGVTCTATPPLSDHSFKDAGNYAVMSSKHTYAAGVRADGLAFTFKTGDVIGMVLDCSGGKLTFTNECIDSHAHTIDIGSARPTHWWPHINLHSEKGCNHIPVVTPPRASFAAICKLMYTHSRPVAVTDNESIIHTRHRWTMTPSPTLTASSLHRSIRPL